MLQSAPSVNILVGTVQSRKLCAEQSYSIWLNPKHFNCALHLLLQTTLIGESISLFISLDCEEKMSEGLRQAALKKIFLEAVVLIYNECYTVLKYAVQYYYETLFSSTA